MISSLHRPTLAKVVDQFQKILEENLLQEVIS